MDLLLSRREYLVPLQGGKLDISIGPDPPGGTCSDCIELCLYPTDTGAPDMLGPPDCCTGFHGFQDYTRTDL